MKTSNPVLQESVFQSLSGAGETEMTMQGTVNKTAISLLILLLTASWVWKNTMAGAGFSPVVWIGLLGGFILAIVTAFKKEWAPITTPVYAGLEGLFLGGISAMFERQYPGLVIQAVVLTFGVLFSLLLLYRAGLIRATDSFKRGIFAATSGIVLVYLVNWIMTFFGSGIPLIHSSGPFGILFSVVVVVIAALNLVLDFDLIEKGVSYRLPKYMEWYGAFALLVTLIWLYIEILRLLAKLSNRR